jgi:hypothetical protein
MYPVHPSFVSFPRDKVSSANKLQSLMGLVDVVFQFSCSVLLLTFPLLLHCNWYGIYGSQSFEINLSTEENACFVA